MDEKKVADESRGAGVRERVQQLVDRYANFVDNLFAENFSKIGRFVGSRPGAAITLALLVLALTCVGYTNFYSESRGDKLWVPQNTRGQKDKDVYEGYFEGSRVQFALIEAKQQDAMLMKPLLQDAMTIYEQVHALSVEVDGEMESLSTICTKDYSNGDPCLVSSVLENWLYNSSLLNAESSDTSILNTINADNEEGDLKNVLGDMQVSNGDVSTAQAAMIYFFIEDNREVVNGEYVDEKAFSWYA